MNCPSYLRDEAREFWKKHAKRLVDSGTLDPDRDAEGFALLCEIWRILRNTDPLGDGKEGVRYSAMLKQYVALGKQYGMLPKDRRTSKMTQPTDIGEVLKKMTERE